MVGSKVTGEIQALGQEEGIVIKGFVSEEEDVYKRQLGALVEVCRELGLSKEDVVSRAMGKFSLPVDETEDLIDRYWNQ